ncbi:MAG: NAD(P)H-dependent oxidoreductase [Phycisphaerae bacterium]|nr:NAD(P)H-dependent oxidoreductase [Phycisphaerae bacterium]
MPILVISSSLNPGSRSRALSALVAEDLRAAGHEPDVLDLRDFPLPLCDGAAAYAHPNVAPLAARVKASEAVAFCFPIYNYNAGAAAKNLIELTGEAWNGKLVALVAAAGGPLAYMAPMTLAAPLMLDFRCLVIPRYVYGPGEHAPSDPKVRARVTELALELLGLSAALRSRK